MRGFQIVFIIQCIYDTMSENTLAIIEVIKCNEIKLILHKGLKKVFFKTMKFVKYVNSKGDYNGF